MPKTFLAFDFGKRFIGVAVGQTLTASANPLPALHAKEGIPDWNAVDQLLKHWQPHGLVVGLPLNMDGSISDIALCAKKFAARLTNRYGLPVQLSDERLSTHAAKERLSNVGKKSNRNRELLNSLAAQVILEQWLTNFNKED